MAFQQFRSKIRRIRHLTKDVRELTLELIDPPKMNFRPGQSIAVTIPNGNSGLSSVRYYSLASLPTLGHEVVLLLNAGEREKGPAKALEEHIGKELKFSGPYGSFYLHDDSGRDLLFVGTGTGIAPLWSMISTLLQQSCFTPIRLIWGLRSEPDIYYQEELQRWKARHENFTYEITLSQPKYSWKGRAGRVTHLLQDICHVDDLAVYVCGNRKMVAEVTSLLHKKGNCLIYRERYEGDAS